MAVVGTDAHLVAVGRATIAVAHEESIVAQAQKVRWEAPNADRTGLGPGTTTVGRFALEGFSVVIWVVVANLDDDASVRGLDGMEFVVVFCLIPGASGDLREPLP